MHTPNDIFSLFLVPIRDAFHQKRLDGKECIGVSHEYMTSQVCSVCKSRGILKSHPSCPKGCDCTRFTCVLPQVVPEGSPLGTPPSLPSKNMSKSYRRRHSRRRLRVLLAEIVESVLSLYCFSKQAKIEILTKFLDQINTEFHLTN